MRISNYLVVEKINDNGIDLCLVFSTRTSRFFVFDDMTWQSICILDFKNLAPELRQKLILAQILVDEKDSELEFTISENKKALLDSKRLYFSIQNTAYCPLGCGYCGQVHTSKQMSLPNQLLLAKRIREKLETGKFDSLVIGWFGAEPLAGLPVIKSLSQVFQKMCDELDIKYTAKITSNGLALTPKIAEHLVNEYNVRQIEITLDGPAEYHDRRRHTKNMQPTFDIIYENVRNLALRSDLEVELSIRCNVDTRNSDGVKPLLAKLASDGLHKAILFYVAPIHSWGNDAHELSAEKEQFAQWEIEWFVEMKRLGFKMFPLLNRVKNPCMAFGDHSELVDPQGNRYNCTEVSLVPAYENVDGKNIHSIGHVNEIIPRNLNHRKHFGGFHDEILEKKWPCSSCNMFPVCGGFCPKEWKEGRAACPSFKFNMNQRLLLQYLDMKEKGFDPIKSSEIL